MVYGPGTVTLARRSVFARRNCMSRTSTACFRRILEIDPIQRRSEAVRVALAPDFAVSDNVQPRAFLRADRKDGGIVLRLFQKLGRDAPQVGSADARRKAMRKLRAIDQPVGLGIRSYQGCREQSGTHERLNCITRVEIPASWNMIDTMVRREGRVLQASEN